jgi:hypothetical protein
LNSNIRTFWKMPRCGVNAREMVTAQRQRTMIAFSLKCLVQNVTSIKAIARIRAITRDSFPTFRHGFEYLAGKNSK